MLNKYIDMQLCTLEWQVETIRCGVRVNSFGAFTKIVYSKLTSNRIRRNYWSTQYHFMLCGKIAINISIRPIVDPHMS